MDDELEYILSLLAQRAFEEACEHDPSLRRKLDYSREMLDLSGTIHDTLGVIKDMLKDWDDSDCSLINSAKIKRELGLLQQITLTLGLKMQQISAKASHIQSEYGDLLQTGGD